MTKKQIDLSEKTNLYKWVNNVEEVTAVVPATKKDLLKEVIPVLEEIKNKWDVEIDADDIYFWICVEDFIIKLKELTHEKA